MDCVSLRSKKTTAYLLAFVVNFVIILLTCGLMLRTHYSLDSYLSWASNQNDVDSHIRNLRFVSALVYKFLALLRINVAKEQGLFTFLYMVTVAALVTCLTKKAMEWMKKDDALSLVGVDIGFLLIFHNALIAEWYLFPECMLMYAISLAGCVGAVLSFLSVQSAKNTSKKVWMGILAFAALSISLGCYQVSIGIYVSLMLIFCFIDPESSISRKIVFSLIGLAIGACACLGNVLCEKILVALKIITPSTRGAALNIHAIIDNIKKIIEKQIEIVNGCGVLPRYALPIFFAIPIGILAVLLIGGRVSFKKFLLALGFAVCVYAGSYIPLYVTSDFWFSQRTLVPIIGFFSFLILAIVSLSSSPKIKGAVAIVALAFLLLNSVQMEDIFANHLTMDSFDRLYAKEIQTQIENYSEAAGVEINSLAISRDQNPTWSYDGIKYVSYDLNVKNMMNLWSNVELINVVNGTNYRRDKMDEAIWEEFFEGKNWDSFSPEEQIVFKDSTAYIVLY